MASRLPSTRPPSLGAALPLIAAVCALTSLACAAPVSAAVRDTRASNSATTLAAGSDGGTGASQSDQGTTPTTKPDATATVEQCLTSVLPSERSATFVGEMTAIPGTTRMEISIGLLERATPESQYRPVTAPGLGSWRSSAAGVKTYTYIKQVTNLAAPAFYRGVVRFRWLNAKGHVIKDEEMRTPRCEQTAPVPTTGSGETPSTTTPTTATGSPSSSALSG
jgi:hypothetical protein